MSTMVHELTVPTGCVDPNPTTQSVYLRGVAINMHAIHRVCGVDISYLSRIFSGERNPTLPYARRIAGAIGLTLDDFVDAIEERRRDILAMRMRLQQQYLERVAQETDEDNSRVLKGLAPIPRMPGTHATDVGKS